MHLLAIVCFEHREGLSSNITRIFMYAVLALFGCLEFRSDNTQLNNTVYVCCSQNSMNMVITKYMLHYNPQHVSSSTLLVLRRTNCIITASGIVTLCKQPYSMPVESGLNRHTVRLFTESDDTRGCNNTICPPEDEQDTARNMLRIVM